MASLPHDVVGWEHGTWVGAIALMLLAVQLPMVPILMSRLVQGPRRLPAVEPGASSGDQIGVVSVVVPTLNEAERIAPCLESLSRQGYEVREILIVDSHSTDGTVEQVKAIQRRDPRFRLIYDDPLPEGWVGRPWALHNGFLQSSEHSQWVLGIDADTQLHPGLVAGLIRAAEGKGYDLVSLSPQFILKSVGEWCLQPALLMTLVYRFGPSGGAGEPAERVMANGQCFLIRRSLLSQLGGYSVAKQSFADDVTLARYAAAQGATVAFLDGSRVLNVRMYDGILDTWSGWGRSLDLKDACSTAQRWGDVVFLFAVQGLPILLTPLLAIALNVAPSSLFLKGALGLNMMLILIRVALLWAIAPSYDFSQPMSQAWGFWLSPLADPCAAFRILLSSTKRPTQWRSRTYSMSHFK